MNYTICGTRSILLRLITCQEKKELGCRTVSFVQRMFAASSSDSSSGNDHEISDGDFDLNPSQHARNRITKPTMPKKMLTDYNDASRSRHAQSNNHYTNTQCDFDNYSDDTGYDLLELECKDPWKREKRNSSEHRYKTFRRDGEKGEFRQGFKDSQWNNPGRFDRGDNWRSQRTKPRDGDNSPSVIRKLLESTGRLEPHYPSSSDEREHSEGKWYNYGLAGPGKKRHAMDWTTKPEIKGEVLFGLYPILLALQQGRRECHQLFMKDSLRESDKPLVVELLSAAAKQDIPVWSCNVGTLDYLSRARPHQSHKNATKQVDRLLDLLTIDGPGAFCRFCAVLQASGHSNVADRLLVIEGLPFLKDNGICSFSVDGAAVSAGTVKYNSRMGVCLDAARLDYVPMEDGDKGLEPREVCKAARLWLVLDSIQDPMNFGAVLRSAYFLGVDRVCAVKENSCALSPVVSKASAGVLELLPIYKLNSLTQFLQTSREEGWQILGTVGKDTGSRDNVVSLREARVTQDTVLILGNEGEGLSSDVTDQCHQLLTIGSRHKLHPGVDSLNVSVATGILLHQLISTIVEDSNVGEVSDGEIVD